MKAEALKRRTRAAAAAAAEGPGGRKSSRNNASAGSVNAARAVTAPGIRKVGTRKLPRLTVWGSVRAAGAAKLKAGEDSKGSDAPLRGGPLSSIILERRGRFTNV